jgi:polyhydroxybutyrate depolymerase
MKNLLLIAFLIAGINLNGQTKYDVKVPIDGKMREFIVSVPTKTPPQAGYPLVIMLHGSSGDKNVFYNSKGWKELGQKENFVTVFPSSLNWCSMEAGNQRYINRFVCGSLMDSICPSELPKLISDVSFCKKMVELISDTLPINSSKVFISGFSNGSCMTHKVAMEAGDVFQAAGGSGGSFHQLDSITPVRRIPLWFMVGTKDDRYLTDRYPVELPFNDSILNYLYRPLNRSLVCQGLTQKYTKLETSFSITYQFTECRPGENCTPYRFTLNKGLTHIYPNGNNYPVDAPNLFWDFFNNPPEVTTTSDTRESIIEASTTISPNPVQDYVSLFAGYKAGTAWSYRISDLQGKEVMYQRNIQVPDIEADVADLLPGIYFITFSDDYYVATRKMVKL